MAEIQFVVADYPPAKNEAKSMLAVGHQHADRVLALLDAASRALPPHTSSPLFGSSSLGLELIVALRRRRPTRTNYPEVSPTCSRPRRGEATCLTSGVSLRSRFTTTTSSSRPSTLRVPAR
ncbi:MAG: hypothetical protein R3C15_15735 [Thermoleophilia bacterium]